MSGPGSGRVESSVRGDGVLVFTPCHGVRVFFPAEDVREGAQLTVECPRDGRQLLLELAADETAESGLQAVWTDPDSVEGGSAR